MAQSHCRVMDPTGTPLNLRTAPNGQILGNLANGVLVAVVDQAVGSTSSRWATTRPSGGCSANSSLVLERRWRRAG